MYICMYVKTDINIVRFLKTLLKKKWIQYKQNQKWSKSLQSAKNIDFFQKVKDVIQWCVMQYNPQWLSCKMSLSYFNKIWTGK